LRLVAVVAVAVTALRALLVLVLLLLLAVAAVAAMLAMLARADAGQAWCAALKPCGSAICPHTLFGLPFFFRS
jgi:hypothetical protein